MKTFAIPGIIKPPGRRKPLEVALFLEAEDRVDALWQANHGVIEANVSKTFPGSTVKYDKRKLRILKG